MTIRECMRRHITGFVFVNAEAVISMMRAVSRILFTPEICSGMHPVRREGTGKAKASEASEPFRQADRKRGGIYRYDRL